MIYRELLHDVKNAVDELVRLGLIRDYNNTVAYPLAVNSWVLSWKKNPKISYLFKSCKPFKGTYPVMQYFEILEKEDYTAIFNDGGLVQISYWVGDSDVLGHRLMFYPCPIAFDEEDFAIHDLKDLREVFGVEYLLDHTQSVTPVRFDFDAKFSDELHANSHVTIGKKTCRIPVYGPIAVGQFFRFVLSNYYADELSSVDALYMLPVREFDRFIKTHHNNPLFFETTSKVRSMKN